ncbi:hypothetical protein TTHERM_01099180 (macronuclear) [Tetrahymena thermophila SB210]|uniref:Outer membrane protein n=1 Tax=Tetrahymena thermophila (strain SB210) TaxID=312017 RepID=Q22BJ5_TETTS|nr:hypothetical protein TTHERM_01099180 [Tetrahymena thermophila SB210]EAR82671.1 hypothetical protein TTHERM_01099180 [Tetrahymena thermophila SB210]|eukprot:XP_001030334.1 hypothetical protein TTHERM_01099180 [Tetrahymena thermophila SB210]
MKQILILFIFLNFLLLTKSNLRSDYNCDESSEQIKLRLLPEPFKVVGKAVGTLRSEQVVIGLSIETLQSIASDSLNKNSEILNNSINSLKQLGLNESEFSTAGIQIYPSYLQIFNNSTQTYSQELEGYKVRNSLIISTQKLQLAGKIIDATIQNGVTNIDYVRYEALDQNIVNLREKLLAEAVKNAQKQANIVLDELNYKIVSVKEIQLLDFQRRNYEYQPSPRNAKVQTLTFEPQNNQEVQVEVSYIIERKRRTDETF